MQRGTNGPGHAVPYPVGVEQEISFCSTSDGVSLAIAQLSSGPPVVYVPGWPGHLQLEWTERHARRFLLRLATGLRLVRYDMRGSGLSDRDAAPTSIEQLVDDLACVVDHLALAQFSLVSLGMAGTPTALHYARRNPDRVRDLVIVSGYLTGTELADAQHRRSLVEYVEQYGYPHFGVIDHPDVGIDDQRAVHRLQEGSCSPAVQAAVLRIMYDSDLSDVAAGVTTPALVFHDRRDPIVPFDEGRRLAAALPASRFVPYEAGTAAPWAVADLLVPRIADFVGAGNRRTGPVMGTLTKREMDVLRLLRSGCTNRQIASELVMSEKTVKTHVSHLLQKLGVHDRTQAALTAVDESLLET